MESESGRTKNAAHIHTYTCRQASICRYVCVCVCVSESFAWVDTKVRKNATQSLRHWQLCAQAHTHTYKHIYITVIYTRMCMRMYVCVSGRLCQVVCDLLMLRRVIELARALSLYARWRQSAECNLLRTVAELTYIKTARGVGGRGMR